jgi:DNA-binding response OmpR family regulator
MKRILIVEDEEKLARLIAQVLREEGYTTEMVGDGHSGLSRALAETFDLLILDWMLPDRSGLQIVRSLRAAEVSVPVLMLTARDQIEDKVEGLDAGADDYTSLSLSPSPSFWHACGPSREGPGERVGPARSSRPGM